MATATETKNYKFNHTMYVPAPSSTSPGGTVEPGGPTRRLVRKADVG